MPGGNGQSRMMKTRNECENKKWCPENRKWMKTSRANLEDDEKMSAKKKQRAGRARPSKWMTMLYDKRIDTEVEVFLMIVQDTRGNLYIAWYSSIIFWPLFFTAQTLKDFCFPEKIFERPSKPWPRTHKATPPNTQEEKLWKIAKRYKRGVAHRRETSYKMNTAPAMIFCVPSIERKIIAFRLHCVKCSKD